MNDGFYAINLEINHALVNIPDVKTTDHASRGMNITRTLNGVVQDTGGQAIYLNATTADGRSIFVAAEVIDTSIGSYMLTYPDSMINVAGVVHIELMIIDPTGTISSNTGTINVTQAVINYSDIMDSEQYPALITALNIIQDMQTQLNNLQNQVNGIQAIPKGTIVMSAIPLDTAYWAPLDGGPTTAYPTLSAIYGGVFPNMNGKVPVGIDAGQTEFNTYMKTGGEKLHALSVGEMPSHIHNLMFYASILENAGHYALLGYNINGAFGDRCLVTTPKTNSSYNYIQPTGSGTAHNNLQPYQVVGKFYVHI
jgi:microcystin-dependent protein